MMPEGKAGVACCGFVERFRLVIGNIRHDRDLRYGPIEFCQRIDQAAIVEAVAAWLRKNGALDCEYVM